MSATGRWALRLELGGVAAVVVSAAIVALTELHAFGLVAFLGLVAIIGGGGCGVFALYRDGERSRLVIASLVPAGFALFLVVGELVLPH